MAGPYRPQRQLGGSRPSRWVLAVAALTASLAVGQVGVAPGAGAKGGKLSVSVGAKGARVSATITSAKAPYRYGVRLNGHTVRDEFDLTVPGLHREILGLDHGLRFGENVLRVTARYPRGREVRRVVRFRVGARRPLIGAPDIGRVHARAAVKLSLRTSLKGASRADRRTFDARQGRISYRWRIVDAPDDSNARLKKPSSRRPRLVPDTAGIYRVEVSVARRGASSSRGAPPVRTDAVQIQAQSPEATRAGVFIGTEPLDAGGDPTALRIFGGDDAGAYPLGDGAQAGQSGVLLVIDRCTLDVVQNSPLHGSVVSDSSGTISSALRQYYPAYAEQHGRCGVMFALAAHNYGQVDQSFADFMNAAVGQSFLSAGDTQPFWAVWIPNQAGAQPDDPPSSNNSWVNSPAVDGQSPAGRMAGVLVEDVSGQYSFRPSNIPAFGAANSLLTFHTDPSGIAIPTLPGEAGYPAPTKIEAGKPGCPGTGLGGFQVLLMPVSGPDALTTARAEVQVAGKTYRNGDTFWINGCDGSGEDAAQAMLELLKLSSGPVPTAVFIQGVGDAMPSDLRDLEQPLLQIAIEIGELGGTPNAFKLDYTPGGPAYAFAGQNFAVPNQSRVQTEVTSEAPGNPPVQLDGVLERDRRWRLAPSVGGPPDGNSTDPSPGEQPAWLALGAASAAVGQGPDFQPAPFPGQGDPEWQKAMHYIAGKDVLSINYDGSTACYKPPIIEDGFGDVRSAFCGGGTSCNEWQSLGNELSRLSFPANQGFSQETWTDVVDELAGGGSAGIGEFAMVDRLNCTVLNMQRIFGDADTTALLNVQEFVSTINAFLEPPQDKGARNLSIVATVFNDMLSIAAPLAALDNAGEASQLLRLVGAGFASSKDVANLADGSPVNGPLPFNTTAETLAQQLTTNWQKTSSALGVLGDQIVSDHTALRQFYESGVRVQQQDITNAETPLSLAAYTYLWKWFIGKAYPPDHAWPNGNAPAPVDPKTFGCHIRSFNSTDLYPFEDLGPDQTIHQIEAPVVANQNGYELYGLAGTYLETDDDPFIPDPPPANLPGSLTKLPPALDGSVPPPVDAGGNITPVGLSYKFLWQDLIYGARQTQRIFQWFDQDSYPSGIPDWPFSEQQNCYPAPG